MNINDLFKPAQADPNSFTLSAPEPQKGNWCGEVGKRAEFVLTCTAIIPLQSGYSVKIYKFTDEQGNDFANFASKDLEWLALNEKYRIRATVKRQTIYNNIRQTQIIRLKKIELFYEPMTTSGQSRDVWMDI